MLCFSVWGACIWKVSMHLNYNNALISPFYDHPYMVRISRGRTWHAAAFVHGYWRKTHATFPHDKANFLVQDGVLAHHGYLKDMHTHPILSRTSVKSASYHCKILLHFSKL